MDVLAERAKESGDRREMKMASNDFKFSDINIPYIQN
jgi:hypothetical protein